jgi:predicted short-subunit dehydrogenase-like oxidoreductase (DUF2520 family)
MSINNNFKNGIVIIGAGNVATHLSLSLKKNNFSISCIYSKTLHSAEKLAGKLNTDFTNDLDKIPKNADLYVLSIKDEKILSVVKNLTIENGIVVHTAGSISVNVFKNHFKDYGVFYPLQTFSKSRELDFSNIPICIEASNQDVKNKLFYLANCLCKSVYEIDSEKRKVLHLAAVYASNFANHMFAVAADILDQADISFDLLKPLIEETALKAIESDPQKAQTGPAVRNDQNVIKNHLEMLNDNQEFEKIYRFVSESIFKLNQEKNK